MSKLVTESERSIYIPEDHETDKSTSITIPKEWVKICGFVRGEKCKAYLMYGKHGYFVAFAPLNQVKIEDEFVAADKLLEKSSRDEKLSESKNSD